MIPLCKIRYTFLKTHPCSLVLGYLFIPVVLIIIFLPVCIIRSIYVRGQRRYGDANIQSNQYKDFLSNSLSKTAIIVNDIKNGEKLTKFIKQETNIQLNYFIEKSILNSKNYDNFIIYNEKDGKNDFDFKIKEKYSNFLKNFDIKKVKDIFKNLKHLKCKHENLAHFHSLIGKYLASENIIRNSNNITQKLDLKKFDSLNESEGDDEIYDIIIAFVISFEMTLLSFNLTERMVEEREKHLNDFLERQGISKKRYALSWFVTYCILSLLPFISFLCFCGSFMIFQYFFLFINLVLFMLCIFSVMNFFNSIISTLKKGSTIIKLFNFASTIIGCSISVPGGQRNIKLIFGIIPHVNIYYTITTMYTISDSYDFELELFTRKIKGISYLESLMFFCIQLIFYNGLSFFIQSYKSSGLNFCLYLKSFCCNVSRNVNNDINEPLVNDNTNNILNYEIHHQNLSLIEQQKRNENKYLKINKVTKKFGQLKAVNNFNGELFSNEIFCLLGHNGAGKTTLVKIISGLMDPEEGDVLLDGVSLLTHKDLIYTNIGLCQQENILFDYLTVKEHLQYIYDIKGIQRNFNEIQELIIKLDLADVQLNQCENLSGGQKRKVCIALALLSGGRIIILDEPTSGMDVIAKKKLWEFLKNYQKEKIILITTHSLEEAEYLGTKIGIMNDGNFICSGTSTYLKSMYPCGININLVINSKTFSEDNKNTIFQKVKEYDPLAEIKIASKGVFSINVQQNNDHIAEIFDYIEESKSQFGIEDYIVSSATLEDVFLKINNKSNIKEMKYLSKNIENQNIIENRVKPEGFCPQLYSQLYRNILPITRNKILFILEYVGGLACSYIFTIFVRSVIYKDRGSIEEEDEMVLIIYGISIILGFIIFLGGVVYEKIKERKTKIKYLLYLSGCNMWSYWCAFFIIDYIKLIIFSALLLLPLYLISDLGLYCFFSMPMMILSSLVFIYFLSSFWRDEDSGTKILLSSLLVAIIVIMLLYSIIIAPAIAENPQLNEIFLNFVPKRYFFSIFDITPISSLGLTFYRLMLSKKKHNLVYDRPIVDEFYSPIEYVFTGILTQFINFLAYFILMVLKETGYIAKCTNCMHSSNSNFVFSEESIAEEFYAHNNLRNPLLNALNNNEVNNVNNINQNNSNNNNVNSNNNINNINNIQNNIINSNNIPNSINEIDINNRNSINNSRNPSENIIEIDTSSNQNNNIHNNINNNNPNNLNNQINQINQIYHVYRNNQAENNIQQNNGLDENLNPFVRYEKEKINNQPGLTTKIEGLYKTFFNCCSRNVRVVNNLYLGLEPNEKFGLLGFNGSGKTTTFRAITNEILYEKGRITLFGYDAKTQFDQVRPIVGYCPQENPLFDYMKVKEIISFYLDLKKSTETIESICATFDLSKYLDTYCINLSGGNKRKLSFAIALMNKPSLLLLDEPSTGVDPESRRIMWKNINALSNTGHKYNMLLTTHSIEEAEILCDRVSWLKRGNFVCIGNPEQLKLKYSNGYKLHIKFVDTVINRSDVSTLTRKMVQDAYIEISNLVKGFNLYSNYILSNPIIILYIRILIEVAKEIVGNTSRIGLIQIEKDFSFLLEIGVIKEKQKDLFTQIFNLKKKNPKIAEISINLESLGNILTLFG